MIISIQYMRGIAALMVVWLHATGQWARLSGGEAQGGLGAAGVDVFFVISGFIMWVTTADGMSATVFIKRRFVRIAPLYWFLTLFVAAIAFLFPSLMSSTRFDLPHTLTSLLFIPWPNPGYPQTLTPVLIAGWTLNYEMGFYVLFALALMLPRPWTLGVTVGTLVALVVLGQYGSFSEPIPYFYTNSIILEFGAGVLLGALYTLGLRLPPLLSVLLVALGVAGLVYFGEASLEYRVLTFGIPAFLIVSGLVFFERSARVYDLPLARLVGDSSYSIYLTQAITLAAFAKVWRLVGFPLQGYGLLFIFLAMTASSLVGIGTYFAIERSLHNLLKKRRSLVAQRA